jgi:hypothetical protein
MMETVDLCMPSSSRPAIGSRRRSRVCQNRRSRVCQNSYRLNGVQNISVPSTHTLESHVALAHHGGCRHTSEVESTGWLACRMHWMIPASLRGQRLHTSVEQFMLDWYMYAQRADDRQMIKCDPASLLEQIPTLARQSNERREDLLTHLMPCYRSSISPTLQQDSSR